MRFLENLKPLGLLALRLALGAAFMFHGYPKLITDTPHSVQMMMKMGFPGYFAYLAGIIELFGGGLLIIGLFTRGAALLLAIEMGVVLLQIPVPGIHALGQYEVPVVFGAAALALATTGAGVISFDAFTFEGGRKTSKKSKA
jgi:putative oxidoreductase